jgi:hypothetical protein
LKWNEIKSLFPAKGGASKFLKCGFFIFYSIEIRKANETLDDYWGHLNELVKGYRSKNFPVPPLAGVGAPSGRFFQNTKALRGKIIRWNSKPF